MLYSEFKGTSVSNKVGVDFGTLKEFTFDPRSGKLNSFIVSPGKKKDDLSYPAYFESFDEKEKKLTYRDGAPTTEAPDHSNAKKFKFEDFIGTVVTSKDGEKVGKVYDIDIATNLKNWEVWKVLIKVGFMKERLRLGMKDIQSINVDGVVLKATSKELEKKAEK